MRTARLQKRSDLFQHKNVICHTYSSKNYNFPLALIIALPPMLTFLFDPVQYLFTDSEYYGTRVSYEVKTCVFFLILTILICCFRSRALIIEDRHDEYQCFYIRVAWIIIYCIATFFIAHGVTVLLNEYCPGITTIPFFYFSVYTIFVLAIPCSGCLFSFCCEHHY